MRITIVAATGGIGRHVLDQTVDAGHEVTAVVREPEKLSHDVRGVAVDLTDPDPQALRSAIDGADAVLSCVGPRSSAEVGIAEQGTRAIVEAMRQTDARRLVVVSAAPVATVPSPGRPNPPRHDPGEDVLTRYALGPLIKVVFRRNYADLARMEDILRDSDLDWTSVRPPMLTDAPLTATCRTAHGQNPRKGHSAARADVAHLMLHALDQPETIGHTMGIAT